MTVSDLVVGALMAIAGMIGLVMAAGAVDEGIYIFGLSLFIYACIFILGQVRRHFDTLDASRGSR